MFVVKKTHGHVGLDPDVVISVTMTYDLTDPLAVSATFHNGDDPEPCWVFSRDLLAHGLNYDVGDGALRLGPKPGHEGGLVVFRIVGQGPSGPATRGTVAVPRNDVREFLQMTGEACAFGDEERHVAVALEEFLESFA